MTPPPPAVYALGNAAGLRLRIGTLGATWLSCRLPTGDGREREVLLAGPDAAGEMHQRHYTGATVGRFTNRIRQARFRLDGREHRLAAGAGPHQLHGGPDGFHRRPWAVLDHGPQHLSLALYSPDGDQGFPGAVDAEAHFTLGDGLALEVRLLARSTAPCPVGLTQHAYFNLDGDAGAATPSVLGHRLQLLSDRWLPPDADGLPEGDWAPVQGRGLDLRQPRRLHEAVAADPALRERGGFDHCYGLDAPGPAARLWSADGRVRLQLDTDQPALQLYTGRHLAGAPARDASPYPAHAGLALEPQFPLDAPNHPVRPPHWPDCVLRPGQVWQSRSLYTFQTETP